MKLWLLSQNEHGGYDTYDSCVVAAKTKLAARRTYPNLSYVWENGAWTATRTDGTKYTPGNYPAWASTVETVKAEYLGEAKEGTVAGVICASFNAG